MGIPAPVGVSASGQPPAGDTANAVVSGVFTAVGPGKPFPFTGPLNVAIWASINTALTTTNGSLTASVGSGTGIAAGQSVNSVNVPRGATWATFSGTSGTLALPTITFPANILSNGRLLNLPSTVGLLGATVAGPNIPSGTTVSAILDAHSVQLSNAPTAMPATNKPQFFEFALGAAAVTTGVDAAATFTGYGITYSGTLQLEKSYDGGQTWIVNTQWTTGAQVIASMGEPESNVLYRLNCAAYTSGTINYRISTTGGAAQSVSLNQL